MSKVGERRRCAICNELVKVTALISNGNGLYTQQLECGHTGRIRIMDPIEEKVDHRYDQTCNEKNPKGSRINASKTLRKKN
jgi:hypothetical protein